MNLKLHYSHPWDISPAEAIAIQNRLRAHIETSDILAEVKTVAGIDVGFEDAGKTTRAAIAVLNYSSLDLIFTSIARRKTTFPYIPGLLSFRELPAILEALSHLDNLPDLFICDGQGYAHPRRFGIACHLGLLTGVPAIGVGKTRLLGNYKVPADRKGNWTPLLDRQEVIGAVLRTRKGVKPVFISIGHRISLDTSIRYVMACTTSYKLPEPTRHAHKLASSRV